MTTGILIKKTFIWCGSLTALEVESVIIMTEVHGGMQVEVVLQLRVLHVSGNRKLADTLGGKMSMTNVEAGPHSDTIPLTRAHPTATKLHPLIVPVIIPMTLWGAITFKLACVETYVTLILLTAFSTISILSHSGLRDSILPCYSLVPVACSVGVHGRRESLP